MKCFISIVLFLSSFSSASYAISIEELPNTLYLKQHWISYSTSFDVETKNNKLGTLSRRVLSLLLTYDFYDKDGRVLTTSTGRFFSLSAHFDVYDVNKTLLGSVEEHIFTFLPTFSIYSITEEKLAQAEMNFWGTAFTIYDAENGEAIAVMSRSFVRIKNDWTIRFKNKSLLQSKNISAELFLTVLAFQADSEYWEQQNSSSKLSSHSNGTSAKEQEISIEKSLREKIALAGNDENLNDVALMDASLLDALVVKLDQDYAQQLNASENLDEIEKVNRFVDFCLDLVKSNKVSREEKKAILYLLQERIGHDIKS